MNPVGANSLLGGRSQPFIQDGGGSGISPAETGPYRQGSLVGGQKTHRPKGSHLPRILLRSLSVRRVLSQFLPPLQAPEKRQVAMVFVTMPPVWSGVPQACPRVAGDCHLEWRMERNPLALGTGLRVSHHLNPKVNPAPSHSSLPPFPHPATLWQPCCIYPFDQFFTCPEFPEDLQWGFKGYSRIRGTGEGRCRHRVKQIWTQIAALPPSSYMPWTSLAISLSLSFLICK